MRKQGGHESEKPGTEKKIKTRELPLLLLSQRTRRLQAAASRGALSCWACWLLLPGLGDDAQRGEGQEPAGQGNH